MSTLTHASSDTTLKTTIEPLTLEKALRMKGINPLSAEFTEAHKDALKKGMTDHANAVEAKFIRLLSRFPGIEVKLCFIPLLVGGAVAAICGALSLGTAVLWQLGWISSALPISCLITAGVGTVLFVWGITFGTYFYRLSQMSALTWRRTALCDWKKPLPPAVAELAARARSAITEHRIPNAHLLVEYPSTDKVKDPLLFVVQLSPSGRTLEEFCLTYWD